MNNPGTVIPMEIASQNAFHLDPDRPNFESLAHSDGFKFWWASDLARLMGYERLDAFRKAMIACDALGVPLAVNFVQERRQVDGSELSGTRLERGRDALADRP